MDSMSDLKHPLLRGFFNYSGANIFDLPTQAFNESIDSPNDMLVDSDDLLVDPENEKDDVAIINPDSDVESSLRADDCRFLSYDMPQLTNICVR